MNKDYKDSIVVLESCEGADFDELKIRAIMGNPDLSWHGAQRGPIRIYAKVIAFEDDGAPGRNWKRKEATPFILKTKRILPKISISIEPLKRLLQHKYG